MNSFWKKFLLIASLSVIVVLIASIITGVAVKVDMKPNYNTQAEVGVLFYTSNTTPVTTFVKDSAENNKVVELINKSFKTNFLTAWTNGYNSKANRNKLTNIASTSLDTIKADAVYALEFRYADSVLQNVIKTYSGDNFKSNADKVQTYNKFLVVVKEANKNYGVIDMYFATDSTNSGSYTNNYTVKLTAYGNFADLYNYLKNQA